MTHRELFLALYRASTETEVEALLKKNPTIFKDGNWFGSQCQQLLCCLGSAVEFDYSRSLEF